MHLTFRYKFCDNSFRATNADVHYTTTGAQPDRHIHTFGTATCSRLTAHRNASIGITLRRRRLRFLLPSLGLRRLTAPIAAQHSKQDYYFSSILLGAERNKAEYSSELTSDKFTQPNSLHLHRNIRRRDSIASTCDKVFSFPFLSLCLFLLRCLFLSYQHF